MNAYAQGRDRRNRPTWRASDGISEAMLYLELALFANSLRCNGASAAEGRPSVARLASSRQPVTPSRHGAGLHR